jgi:hypothetical protein
MPARKRKPKDASVRVRHLIALDAQTVMKRLHERQVEMVRLFSRLRDRGPLLGVVQSWFQSITFAELSQLDPPEQSVAVGFYEQLDALRWYLQYTEDMPLQVQQQVAKRVTALGQAHRTLNAALGPPDGSGGTVLDAVVLERKVAGRL